MNIIDRYIAGTVVAYSALVMGVLLTLGGLFVFIGQQDDIGVGNYGAADALLFSVLNLPQQAFELMPIAVLIGALLGMGALARGSELAVLRASGVSIARLAYAVLAGSAIMMIVAALLGELVAPPLQKFARQQRAFSKYADVSFAGSGSAWVKDGDTLLSVQEQTGDNLFGGVFLYQLEGDDRLVSVGRADRATVREGQGGWRLHRYTETRFLDGGRGGTEVRKLAELELRTGLDPGFLGLAVSEPRQLPSMGLLRLMQHLRANGLETDTYEFAFWSRIARTASILIVAVLALPFALGPLRSSGAGARMVIGILIGIAFFLLQRTLESGTIVFDLDPLILAWVPTALLATVTTVLLARTR
jgi:lipopolysaccharide export system permease protein